jgi:hypothetical protein
MRFTPPPALPHPSPTPCPATSHPAPQPLPPPPGWPRAGRGLLRHQGQPPPAAAASAPGRAARRGAAGHRRPHARAAASLRHLPQPRPAGERGRRRGTPLPHVEHPSRFRHTPASPFPQPACLLHLLRQVPLAKHIAHPWHTPACLPACLIRLLAHGKHPYRFRHTPTAPYPQPACFTCSARSSFFTNTPPPGPCRKCRRRRDTPLLLGPLLAFMAAGILAAGQSRLLCIHVPFALAPRHPRRRACRCGARCWAWPSPAACMR